MKNVNHLDNFELQSRLEIVYYLYPRKLGKSQGMRAARHQCKTVEKIEELKAAIKNYAQFIADSGTEPQFIMYFGTFMNQWRDWLDPEQGKIMLAKQGPELSPEAFE